MTRKADETDEIGAVAAKPRVAVIPSPSSMREGVEAAKRIVEAPKTGYPIGQNLRHDAVTVARALLQSERGEVIELCAKAAQRNLEEWASDLAFTRDEYIAAITGGTFNGRPITENSARTFAREFRQRSEAVHEAAEHTAKAIRALKD